MKPLDRELLSAIHELPETFGPIWSGPAHDLAMFAADLDGEEERRRSFQHALAAGYFTQFTAYSDPVFAERVVDWQLSELKASGLVLADLPPTIAESPLVRRETLVKRENRLLSPDFLRYLAYAWLLQRHSVLARSGPRILEIGSGYGGMARVLKLFVPDATIVLTDLPSSLVYAYLFLCTEFPDARAVVAKEGVPPHELEGADFVFVPVHRTSCLRGMNIDLAMNVWSFGEIPNERNQQWFQLLQHDVNVDWLFLLNSFLKRVGPHSGGDLGFGKWLTQLDAKWRVADFEIDPRIHRCPYVTSFPSGAAVLAQRIRCAHEFANEQAKAKEQFDSMLPADWISSLGPLDAKGFDPSRFIAASHHVGRWNADPGTNGPVFRLWQHFRLNQDERALRLLLAHLRIVRGAGGDAFRFKDEFFIREILSPEDLIEEQAAFFRDEQSIVLEIKIQAACDLATKLQRNDMLNEAAFLFNKILEVVPDYAESMFQLGAIAETRGEPERAREWYLKASALSPDNPNYRERALRVCVDLAWRHLFQLERIGDSAPPATASLSRQQRCFESVKQEFEKHGLSPEGESATPFAPSTALMQEVMALACNLIEKENRHEEAERLRAAIVEVAPDYSVSWSQLAVVETKAVCVGRGRLAMALRLWKRCFDAVRRRSWRAATIVLRACLSRIRRDRLVEWQGRTLSAQQTFDAAFDSERQGRAEEALQLYRLLVESFPNYAEGWFRMGTLAEQRGNRVMALAYYKTAVKLVPGHPPYEAALGRFSASAA